MMVFDGRFVQRNMYICIYMKRKEKFVASGERKCGCTRNDEKSSGNTWMPLIKMFQSFSRVVGFLPARCGLERTFFFSCRRNTPYIFMTFLPGLS